MLLRFKLMEAFWPGYSRIFTNLSLIAARPEKHRHAGVIASVIVSILLCASLTGLYFLWKRNLLQTCLQASFTQLYLAPQSKSYRKTCIERTTRVTRLWSTEEGCPQEGDRSCDGLLNNKALSPSGESPRKPNNKSKPIAVTKSPV